MTCLLLGRYPEEELLDQMVVLFLIFGGASTLVSIVAAPIYIPTNSAQGSLFSTSLPVVISCLFCGSHSDRREVMAPCALGLQLPDD